MKFLNSTTVALFGAFCVGIVFHEIFTGRNIFYGIVIFWLATFLAYLLAVRKIRKEGAQVK